MTALRAYHNQQAVKEWYLTRLRQHYRAGEIVECGLEGLSHSSCAKPLSAECVVDPISMLRVFARRSASSRVG
jgi:hypothetical protein